MKTFTAVVLAALTTTSLATSHSSQLSPRRHHARGVDHATALAKRATYSGYATWYDVGTGNAGACGEYLSPDEYVVALNQPMYGDLGQKSSWCGQTITISNGQTTANARIMDACPTGNGNCYYGSLDMSQGLFEHFANTGVGKFPITWWPAGSGGGSSGSSNNNNDNSGNDNSGNSNDGSAAAAAAAAAKKKAQQAAASAAAEAAAASSSAAAAASSAAAEASASLSSARASASSAAAARSSSRAAASLASAKASKSRASVKASKSRAAAKASASSASAAAAAAAATPTGNLNNFANLYDGLSNMIMDQAQASS